MKVIVVYDDNIEKSEMIEDVIGQIGFSNIVINKKNLEEYFTEAMDEVYDEIIFKKIESEFDYAKVAQELDVLLDSEYKVAYSFSDYFIADKETMGLSYKKLQFIDTPYVATTESNIAAVFFPDVRELKKYLKTVSMGQAAKTVALDIKDSFEIEGLIDLSNIDNFIQCLTGKYDSRYFNSLESDNYTIVKSSSNKKKIKAEYEFYHLLPDDMKYWFVMPFNYEEDENKASYTMERLHMTDLAIKWVHNSISEKDLGILLDKYFHFFACRHKKECSADEYTSKAEDLYITKVEDRVKELKNHPKFGEIDSLLKLNKETELDYLVDKYKKLKDKVEGQNNYENCLVIGHGDPCFANALYNKSTKMLKFIDPKGATKEEDLWVNPYYDIAKLSHSICGSYDFFNNAMFEIKINEDNYCELDVPCCNKKYLDIFKKALEQNGFDYKTVRVYEASLFLSMLPLHMDNPHKVLGFILNAKRIMDELEREM